MSFFQHPLFGKRLKNFSLPSFSQWIKLPKLLSFKERGALLALLVLFAGSFAFLVQGIYEHNTTVVPARGGSFVEGMVGNPRFLNPVFAETNDVDRSLTQLLFSGLLRYNSTGTLVPDLAKEYTVDPAGKVFEVQLRKDVRWHDGYAFDAEDVIYTIQTIQDPRYKSPVRANWVGVSIEKVSQYKVRFVLAEPFAAFPHRLTQKILPRHVWEDISPENFALSVFNLQPVGTGPYRLIDLKRNKSGAVEEIELRVNSQHHLKGPFIRNITFRFFATEDEMLSAANLGKIQSFPLQSSPPKRFRAANLAAYEYSFPRYFAAFFHLDADNSPITEENVRRALSLAVDKEALIQELFQGNGTPVDSPVRASLFGIAAPLNQGVDLEKAFELLSAEGYVFQDGQLIEQQRSSGEFSQDLKRGDQGAAVIALQECLARDPEVYPDGVVNGVFGPATEQGVTKFQEKYAADILTPVALSKGTGTVGPSTRTQLAVLCSEPKSTEPLTLTITTLAQHPLPEVASFLSKSWEQLGIVTEVQSIPNGDLERNVIKPRNYEILLFGEILGRVPDPLPFWHSTQTKDPGLNLSAYESNAADKLLEQIRTELDEEQRKDLLAQLQDTLLQDVPALFLYDLPFRYAVSKDVKGVMPQLLEDPSQRFSGILDWYIETKRVWVR